MKKAIIITIRIVAFVVLAVSLIIIGKYVIEDIHDSRTETDIRHLKNKGSSDELPDILEDYATLYSENNDVIGWLKIPGTSIDYVVMHAPDEPEKYLHKDFYGNPSNRGCLYVAESCDVLKSDNVIIYGHHMKDGSMFGDLVDYSSESFYKTHKKIYFDTIYEKHSYEIVGVIKTEIPADDEDCFRYYCYTGENDTEMFEQYKEFIEENAKFVKNLDI